MAGYFQAGEKKVRPGGYFNVQKKEGEDAFGAVDGVVAVLFRSSFGPLGQAVVIGREEGYERVLGTGGGRGGRREA